MTFRLGVSLGLWQHCGPNGPKTPFLHPPPRKLLTAQQQLAMLQNRLVTPQQPLAMQPQHLLMRQHQLAVPQKPLVVSHQQVLMPQQQLMMP